MMKPSRWFASLAVGASLLLVACGDDDKGASSASTTNTTNISGTVATGAAMTSGSVTLKCGSSVTRTATISTTGTWSTTVPTVNLPCAVEATDGTNSYYSFTVGNGSSIVTNVTPLTTLALAQILGATPDSLFASLSATDLAKLNTSAINAAIAALNAALASYALPAGFNPVTTPLTAATSTQSGNAYDDLLEQFGAANTDLTALVTAAATGTLPMLATPSYTPGVTSLEDFFTTFAGDYTLKVTSVASEGVSAGAAALFPLDSARGVSIKANGDVTFAAVGRTITYAAADYNRDFMGTASTQNQVRYRRKDNNWLELYITYDPATGELHADPSGFLSNSEGLAMLEGTIFVPPTTAPEPVTCNSGDDKLVFTNGPADFCGFTRSASANSISNYFQFTSAAGTHGVTYVKFDMNSDDSAVLKVTIENDAYAFGCGGALPACTGVSISTGSSYKQFTLTGTALAVINGASEGITVNGLLIHPVTAGGGGGTGGSGTLAQQLSAPFAGTYLLSCYSNGSSSTLVERTVVINADGSSTLDGNAVIASGHGGQISLRRSATGQYGYEGFYHDPVSFKETRFDLNFKSDGTLVTDFNRSHSAYVDGLGGSCTGISGPSVGSAAIDMSTLPALIGGYALTDTLTCSGAPAPLPTGLTTVAIDSDGTLRAGSFSLAPSQYVAAGKAFTIKDGVSIPGGGFLTPAAISFTVGGDVPDGDSGSVAAGFFFRFDKDKNATFVQASRNPDTAQCLP